MRSVRTLSGLAGAGASLKDAGSGGGGATSGTAFVVDHKFGPGDGANVPEYSASVTLEGVESGDLLVAITYASSSFGADATGNYGRTEVTDAGWTEAAEIAGTLRIFKKVADGSETTVSATAVRSGGLTVWALRGVADPSAADIASWELYENFDNNVSGINHSAMADQTFDVVLFGIPRGSTAITMSARSGETWNAKSTVFSDAGSGMQSFTFFAPSGLGDFRISMIESVSDLHTNTHVRLGLRFT